jgi:EAL domain-containing protein (putative c-di-GMP-specific phosphodiesterase class I)
MADIIKIDCSFVSGLVTSREDAAIVSASMALAGALDLRVVAEGVEALDQIVALNRLGCHYAQGYAVGKPAPLDEALGQWERTYLFPPPPASEAP